MRTWLQQLPTTNLRLLVTLVCMLLTTLRYVGSAAWVPDSGWLCFLAVMSGLDVTQFGVKRATFRADAAAPAEPGGT